jgi:hypothetical protein
MASPSCALPAEAGVSPKGRGDTRACRDAGREIQASFTHTCLIRVYSSIEYIDMSFP